MTGQVSDEVNYKGENYALVDAVPGPVYNPYEHSEIDWGPHVPDEDGMYSVSIRTGCHRGYQCFFSVEKKLLIYSILNHGTLGEEMLKKGTTIQTDYTGAILIAKDPLVEILLWMGFVQAWDFRTIWKLNFEKGTLVAEKNVSQDIEDFRKHWLHKCDPKIAYIKPEDRPSARRFYRRRLGNKFSC